MKKFPLISVIVPIYNVDKYLERCLNSIINQKYREIEIILVDDGSTDSSLSISETFENKDCRVKLFRKENGGLSSARNLGIDVAKGEYIAFVDSDDFVSDIYIEKLYKLLTIYNADVVICSYYKGKFTEFPQKKEKEKIEILEVNTLLEQWHTKYKKYETVAWNKLYKKSLFSEQGQEIMFPIGRYHEDVFISHRIISNAKRIVITNKKLYVYYFRNDSITNVVKWDRMEDCIIGQKERIGYFRDNGYINTEERLLILLAKHCIQNFCSLDCSNIEAATRNRDWCMAEFKEIYSYVKEIKSINCFSRHLFQVFYLMPKTVSIFAYPILKIRFLYSFVVSILDKD